ncbi:hypothetical protein P171DRAFT_479361 [Karstenula rhodostoma CBS 690.94]|uniref:Uncharacterized protein n=1 Tax=Karstenula rhodostoma CBS 690.94 TaxID=1392251 RepID=A0A9P4UFP7_9PLEO|nr:hypothetical protein P171DRAFT_479361 [Karstenula rhodostoma CBS 690.94]
MPRANHRNRSRSRSLPRRPMQPSLSSNLLYNFPNRERLTFEESIALYLLIDKVSFTEQLKEGFCEIWAEVNDLKEENKQLKRDNRRLARDKEYAIRRRGAAEEQVEMLVMELEELKEESKRGFWDKLWFRT